MPTTRTTSPTRTARVVPGESMRRPTDWTRKPHVRPTTHSSAENAIGADETCDDMSAGRTAYAHAAAPKTHGAIGSTTNRNRRWPMAGMRRSSRNDDVERDAASTVSGVRRTSTAAIAVTTMLTRYDSSSG